MLTAITVSLPTQFHLTCILYQIHPQEFLQNLISHIIIPTDHTEPDQQTLLATDYFLEYAALNTPHTNSYSKEQQTFLRRKRAQYERLLMHSAECTVGEREAVGGLFLEEWLREWEKLNEVT